MAKKLKSLTQAKAVTTKVSPAVAKAPPKVDDSSDEDVPLAQMIKLIEKNKPETPSKTKSTLPASKSVKSEKIIIVSKSEKSTKPEKTLKLEKSITKSRASPNKASSKKDPQSEAETGGEEEDDDEYKWWENPAWDDTVKWESLEHNGVYFPPSYVPHRVKMHYDGKEIALEPEAEEVAGFFAAIVGTDYASNPVFCKNFFEDFKKVLERINSAFKDLITDLNKCDFTPMTRHFEALKLERRNMTKEEKSIIKEEKAKIDEHYGWCLLNGRKEKVGNFRIEPPGLFRGRGAHPRTGHLKERVRPEDITINIGRGIKPPSPPPGHKWGNVVHNDRVTWLASWTENVNGNIKYVQLGAVSSLKGQSDFKKFEKARELKKHINSIRAKNAEELRSKEMAVRQRATALWLIDHLAIRAGNEKGDDEADTVGCCSLRCEHVTLDAEACTVTFDFLGKDSIRYFNTVKVDPIIVKNLGIFMRPPKTPSDPIFDRLNTNLLNSYLSDLMPGLSAKVFRTYNASFTMQQELGKLDHKAEITTAEKILEYNRANRAVAILCNHQRSVPKSHQESIAKLNEKILTLKYQRLLLKRQMREIVDKKFYKQHGIDEDEPDVSKAVEKRKEKELREEAEARHRKKLEKMAAEGKEVDLEGKPAEPNSTRQASLEILQKRLASLNERIEAASHNIVDREENKTTALGTSKINYIDPRITSSWCKLHQVPIEKMFAKTLRDKFKWAMEVDEHWRF